MARSSFFSESRQWPLTAGLVVVSGGLRTRETSSIFRWPGLIARALASKGLELGMCTAQYVSGRIALASVLALSMSALGCRKSPSVSSGLLRARQWSSTFNSQWTFAHSRLVGGTSGSMCAIPCEGKRFTTLGRVFLLTA